jgi:hypothetical protein
VRPKKHALHELTALSLKVAQNTSFSLCLDGLKEALGDAKAWSISLSITVSESSEESSSHKKIRNQMELSEIQIIESTLLSAEEAWIICNRDAPQVPQTLRDTLPVPCILTGDAERARHTLNLLRAASLRRGKSTLRKTLPKKVSR